MIDDSERREVARRLRELSGDSTYPDLIGVIADRDGWYPAADAADRLADLIEPSCDRDALLRLARYMDKDVAETEAHFSNVISTKSVSEYARRIREACNVVDAG